MALVYLNQFTSRLSHEAAVETDLICAGLIALGLVSEIRLVCSLPCSCRELQGLFTLHEDFPSSVFNKKTACDIDGK